MALISGAGGSFVPRSPAGIIRRLGRVAGERGGILDMHNWRTRVWKPACEAAGLPATVPYEMRHTFASLLIHAGRSAPYVAAVMGHSRTSTAQDHYGHWFDARDLRTGVPWRRPSRRPGRRSSSAAS